MSNTTDFISRPLRQQDIDRREGTADDFVLRHTLGATLAARQGPAAVEEFLPKLLPRVADFRNLRAARQYLARKDTAPGPNGCRFEDYYDEEIWPELRQLSEAISSGQYHAGDELVIHVRKRRGSTATRPIVLMDIQDRVVHRGLQQIIQPLLDPSFDNHSFGGRPGRGPLHALARASVLVREQKRLVWITEDIRDCFTQVPLARLLQVLEKRLPARELIELVGRAIHHERGKGLAQGSPLAPLLTNTYLGHFIDRRWRELYYLVPLLRFIDDMLAMCADLAEARLAYDTLQRICQDAAMPLKGTAATAIHDLAAGQRAEWLGYQISHGALGLEIRLAPGRESAEPHGDWLDRLADGLTRAHQHVDAPLRAFRVIEGLVDHAGPCLPFIDQEQLYEQMRTTAQQFGFTEVPTFYEFSSRLRAAHRRWRRLRRAALSEYRLEQASQTLPATRPSPQRYSNADPRPCFELHTDGSCQRPRGRGGWAFILVDANRKERPQYCRLRRTTNNAAELLAVIRGLEATPDRAAVRVFSDSQYVVLGIRGRLARWKARGWRIGKPGRYRPLEHRGLWKRLDALMASREVECQWVRGHSGNKYNEKCDQAARWAAECACPAGRP
jgi:ribonuclease HI